MSKLVSEEALVKYVPEKFERDEYGVITSCSWKEEHVTRPSYLGLDVWISKFEMSEDFTHVTKQIAELLGIQHAKVRHPFSAFLYHIVVDGFKEDDINLLIDDLEGKLPSWQITIRLSGVIPADEGIVIQKGIKLRKVRKEDLTREVSLHPLFGMRDWLMCDSILELHVPKGNAHDVSEKLEKLLVLLMLYREAAIGYKNYTMIPKSFQHFGGTISTGALTSGQPRIIITQQDAVNISAFIAKLEPILPKNVVFGRPIDPLEVSLKRYLDSLRLNVGVEEKLTYAVMGLESLFLKAQPEARYRLAVRAAHVLGHLNENPSVVYSTASEAYQYRSLHVHGSVLGSEKQARAKEVLEKIQKYLRKVILFWLLAGVLSEAKKYQLIREVDSALIAENKAQSLKSELLAVSNSLEGAF